MNVKALFKITYGLYIISSKRGEKMNGYIANTVFQVTSEPPQIAIVCNKNNFTAKLIQESEVFSISVLQKETKPDLIGLFGYKCGKNTNKFEHINYAMGKTGAPIVLDDTISWFECEVVQNFDVGSHIIFIGRIINSDLLAEEKEPLTYSYYRNVKKGKAPKNAPTYIKEDVYEKVSTNKKRYKCLVCGHIYDPEEGDPESGIAPGTAFEDLPDDWTCPVCGAKKENFEEIK